jgi:hypothetical protein
MVWRGKGPLTARGLDLASFLHMLIHDVLEIALHAYVLSIGVAAVFALWQLVQSF